MPEELIIVVVVEGGMVQGVYSSQEMPNARVVVVDYDDLDSEDMVQGDTCSVSEPELLYDEDFIAAVMEVA